MPADYVDDDLARGQGDAAWRVRFRGAAGEWLYLLVLLEFQSTVDPRMAARILAYTARMYLKLIRGGELPPDGRLPPVLPVVIYNGERRWSAATEMEETIAAVGEALAPFQPRQRHLVIDKHRLSIEDLPEENVVSAQIALEQVRSGRTGEAAMARAREFDDATLERWFDHKRTIEALLRSFAPATVARTLDFITLEQLPADYVDDDIA